MLEGAVEGAERGAALTKRLLAFARRQELRYEPVDAAALVRSMLELMGRSVGPGVLISTDLPPDLPAPRSAEGQNQLKLALLNLAVNARDAMPLGGTLAIAVRHALFLPEGAKAKDPRMRAEGGYVVITVRDSGVGMDPETLARAAEPFFTTKGVGQGTELGLSMVDGLATQSGGALRIESRPNEGTEIRLWLPVAAAAAQTASIAGGPLAGAAAEDGPSTLHAARQRSILLVDDDALVLSGTAAMLEDVGHTVTEAASGREALETLRSPARLDLMITDFAMPGMTGVELARAAREARPGLPVILATGFADLRSGTDLGLPPFSSSPTARRIWQRAWRKFKATAARPRTWWLWRRRGGRECPPRRQSSRMLLAWITSRNVSRCCFRCAVKAAVSSGVGSTPVAASRSLTSCVAVALAHSAANRSTIACGVPLGTR